MKSAQLQIRLTPAQKALLQQRARAAGQDVSHYVLSRVVPDSSLRFAELAAALADPATHTVTLAHLNDFLASLPADELLRAVDQGLPPGLSPRLQNLATAMIEHALARKGSPSPQWVREVAPLEAPWFATDLGRLRAHLLRVSPTAFRRRNLFVDSTVGDRV